MASAVECRQGLGPHLRLPLRSGRRPDFHHPGLPCRRPVWSTHLTVGREKGFPWLPTQRRREPGGKHNGSPGLSALGELSAGLEP